MGWSLTVNSTVAVDGGWDAEASRLRAQLDTIGDLIEREYHDKAVTWRSETMTADQWRDPDAIVAEILRGRMRNEDDGASVLPDASASGLVQVYRGEHSHMLATCLWRVGGTETPTRFFASYDFEVGDPADGLARELNEHDPAWLVELLCATAASVDAETADIRYAPLGRALRKARRETARRLGALTYVPRGLPASNLPESVRAYPSTGASPNGVVLVADLDRAIGDPRSLIDDLLTVDDLLMTHQSTSDTQPDRT